MKKPSFLLLFALVASLQSCLSDEYDIDMVFIKGGTFAMGCEDEDADSDESPVHEVRVADFYLGRYEVTQAQWNRIMRKKNPSLFPNDDSPVECVSWYDTELFIRRLNAETGRRYRLPTEAEWEYAARGGKYAEESKYSGSDSLRLVGWYVRTSDSTTHPVGTLSPNELGLFDLSENVHEWCSDRYDSLGYERADEPDFCKNDDRRVFRGGSWYSDDAHCRITNRNHASAEMRNFTLGFRLAEDAQP